MKLTATSFSSRKLQATVDIHAPLPIVWEALTDYDRLGTFIPSLVENKCLERRKGGCLLYQVRRDGDDTVCVCVAEGLALQAGLCHASCQHCSCNVVTLSHTHIHTLSVAHTAVPTAVTRPWETPLLASQAQAH